MDIGQIILALCKLMLLLLLSKQTRMGVVGLYIFYGPLAVHPYMPAVTPESNPAGLFYFD